MHALAFRNIQFDVIDHNGQPWLGVTQIGLALEYANPETAITKLFNRNAEEFTDKMTALIEMSTNGGVQQVRIFSLRGAHLLGMFARTAVAKEFRKWVLDVLEGIADAPAPSKAKGKPKALPGRLTSDQQEAIKGMVKARVEALPESKQAGAAIRCWSSLKSKFGCSYKEIDSAQFTEAVSLLARLPLEGELLPAELPTPAPRLDINFPVSRWLKDSPAFAKSQEMYAPGSLLLTAGMLCGMDVLSPTLRLLGDLSRAGYVVDACKLEVLAMRDHLTSLSRALSDIQKQSSGPLQQGVRFRLT